MNATSHAKQPTSYLCYLTATELARQIRDRQISSAEATEAFLARIAAHNGKINAIAQLFARDARARAKDADDALARDQIWGPLHGVPVTIKEPFLMVPIGVQLIGPYWSEPELLHIATQLAPLTKGFVAPEGF